jgi:lipoprotein-anchoring transpeptidase ErfK/SrfK
MGVTVARGRHARHIAGGIIPVLLIVLAVLALLGGGATFAAIRYDRSGADTILPGITIDGVQVGRMTRSQAIAAVRAEASLRLDSELTVHAAGRAWTATARDLGVRADVAGAVDEALEASGSMSLVSRVYHRISDEPVHRSIAVGWRYGEGKVTTFVKGVADDVAVSPRDASVSLDGTQVSFHHAAPGRALKTELAAGQILAALQDGSGAPLHLATKPVAPKIRDDEVGTTIVIDKEQNTLALYQGFELDRTYSVATAMAPYETPSGTWTIIDKAENPTWTNPAPDTWGADLPMTIPPGPGNPLGTRALYLNAPGIRIHGTYDSGSIGTHASHGCIRMNIDDIEQMYPMVPVGSKVLVY